MRTSLLTSAALILSLSASVGFTATSSTAAATTRPSQNATPRVPKAPAAPAAPRQLTISVDWGDAMTARESGLWIGYLFARMDFIGRNGGRYHRVPGVIIPIFDEEVFARGEAAKIYRNLKRNVWSTAPPDLRITEFDRWSRGNLTSKHAPETRGNVVFSTSGS